MTRIDSEKRSISYSSEKVFTFISNFKNFESLLPSEKVENFQFTDDSCSFRIKGMTDLGLKISEKTEYNLIKMVSDGKVPFPFTMNVHIASVNDEQCEVYIQFEGEINAFMKMMVEKPLTNFFNMLVEKLAELKLEQFL